MSEQDALLHTIVENLHEDAPRLIFADRFEEHGDPDRAAHGKQTRRTGTMYSR